MLSFVFYYLSCRLLESHSNSSFCCFSHSPSMLLSEWSFQSANLILFPYLQKNNGYSAPVEEISNFWTEHTRPGMFGYLTNLPTFTFYLCHITVKVPTSYWEFNFLSVTSLIAGDTFQMSSLWLRMLFLLCSFSKSQDLMQAATPLRNLCRPSEVREFSMISQYPHLVSNTAISIIWGMVVYISSREGLYFIQFCILSTSTVSGK